MSIEDLNVNVTTLRDEEKEQLIRSLESELIEDRTNQTAPCPLGFICDGSRMANCTKIRAVPVGFLFGDVHAGAYCPEGKDTMSICPVGHYCPTPEEMIECPAGYFCPHKTAIPAVRCQGCMKGETTLVREQYGFYVIMVGFLATFLWVVHSLLKRRKMNVLAHIQSLTSRSLDSAMSVLYARQQQKPLVRLKPKLYRIQQRLQAVFDEKDGGQAASASRGVWIRESGKVQYDAKKLFDILDVNQDGFLSYSELQLVLELKPEQLKEFVWLMNQLGEGKDDTKVSRATFSRYFLQVLGETTYFGPTEDEVKELYVELLAGEAGILYTSLYDSQLSLFLSDPQINQLITLFKNAAAKRYRTESLRSILTGNQTQIAGGSSDMFTNMEEGAMLTTGRMQPGMQDPKKYLLYDLFIENYAKFLAQVTESKHSEHDSFITNGETSTRGVDLAFEDLCLKVSVGGKEINVVNNVSGRLQAATMTALMGGSGAGKTSLLNALCGRAFYGTTTGTVRINGQEALIEEHTDATGFVPQSDDSVHPELTVKENLVYSGRFTLPKGTPLSEIEEYADEVLASLGLSRVANSIVGDVNRRGVSGGEKKRVNIGVELMSKPSILFLDEPTSGLDSSSALLVMGSLKNLVKATRMTICSVIHQPRKQIFESFDSLLLLGVGGNMVYHGPVPEAQTYFGKLKAPYFLPPGESLADWLIDISSGRLAPDETADSQSSGKIEEDDDFPADSAIHAVSPRGPSSAKFDASIENEKARRQVLYDSWNAYYKSLSNEARAIYVAPGQYDLPKSIVRPSFILQLFIQIGRNFLLMWRNLTSKLIDTMLIVGAVALITGFEGKAEFTKPWDPILSFDQLVEGDPMQIPFTFPELFRHAIAGTMGSIQFSLKASVISAVLLGLTAAKALTSKKLEFFRESGSGWNVNAYYLSVNITSTLEHTLQMFLAAGCAYWLRDSMTYSFYAYQFHFMMLMWLVVSWSLFLPIFVPPNNVVLVVGFFIAFFGMLFSGGLPPLLYKDLYESDATQIFSGMFSVTRFFIEGMTVQEMKAMPEQAGFTVRPESVNFPYSQAGSFAIAGVGQKDLSVLQESQYGWYWSALPALMVGLTIRVLGVGAIHTFDRSRQNKKSLWYELRKDSLCSNRTFYSMLVYLVFTGALIGVCVWSIVTVKGETGINPPPANQDEFLTLSSQALEEKFPGYNTSDTNSTLPTKFFTF